MFLKLIAITFGSYLISKFFKSISEIDGSITSGTNVDMEKMDSAIFAKAPELKKYYDWVTTNRVANVEEYFQWRSALEKYNNSYHLITGIQLDNLKQYRRSIKGEGILLTADSSGIKVNFKGVGQARISLFDNFYHDAERAKKTRDKAKNLLVGDKVTVKFSASPLGSDRLDSGEIL